MKTLPIAAFGTVAYLVTAEPGDKVDLPLDENGIYANGYYYFISGETTPVVKGTGELLGKRSRGWLNSEKTAEFGTSGAGGVASTSVGGTICMEFPVTTSWVCLPNSEALATKTLVSAEHLIGSIVNFSKGDDVFLADGQITIGAKVFTSPAQIRIRSGDVAGTADVDSLTLKFINKV